VAEGQGKSANGDLSNLVVDVMSSFSLSSIKDGNSLKRGKGYKSLFFKISHHEHTSFDELVDIKK